MSLSNALFAGLSGLDVNQTRLNVVGNNIANVNTVAFKSTRALFKPQFYVTDSGGSQPEGEFGGTNPNQRGLGAVVASLDRNFTPGSIETTGKATDLAIDGDGFFVVQSDSRKYTRDGTFTLNKANQLVTTGGDYVQGYSVDKDFNIIPGQLGNVTIPLGTLTTAQATTSATLEGNLNAAGAVASAASVISTQQIQTIDGSAIDSNTLLSNVQDPATGLPLFNDGEVLAFSGKKAGRTIGEGTFTVDGAVSTLNDLTTFFQQRLGINTTIPDDGNADTPDAGVLVLQDGGDPSLGNLVITGNLGTDNEITLTAGSFTTNSNVAPFTFAPAADAAGLPIKAAGESVRTSFEVYDSLGTPLRVNVTMVLDQVAPTGTTWRFFAEAADDLSPTVQDLVIGTGTLQFDSLGKLRGGSTGANLTISRDGTGAATPLGVTLDFTSMTSFTSQTSELAMTSQDGSPIGTLSNFNIGADGRITGSFTNGINRNLGQVAVATFTNAQGLTDLGGNMFIEGPGSGTAIVGTPGTFGTGKLVSGALELSNVDLSEEFINLIIASTGFSAASRVITTSDQLIQELLNTSR